MGVGWGEAKRCDCLRVYDLTLKMLCKLLSRSLRLFACLRFDTENVM